SSSLPGETLRQVNATVEDAPDERLAEATNQTELGPAAKSKRVHQVQKLAFQLHVRQGALAFQVPLNPERFCGRHCQKDDRARSPDSQQAIANVQTLPDAQGAVLAGIGDER